MMKNNPCFSEDHPNFHLESWLDNASIQDMDTFFTTLSAIKTRGAQPHLIGSIITQYASKWLHHDDDEDDDADDDNLTASWMKKRFFIETLVKVLPPQKDSLSCTFLLGLLRTGNAAGVEAESRAEIEQRVARQLDQASLEDLVLPSLLDAEVVHRLVLKFLELSGEATSRAAMAKVVNLVDGYLAQAAATDENLGLMEFAALASALPSHARVADDGLYRAIDAYLKAHPGLSKQGRKSLFALVDCRKLSAEASLHAAQNRQLPTRSVIQVLFSEQAKLNRHIDCISSLGSGRSPNPGFASPAALHLSSRRMMAQKVEIKKLREDVAGIQNQFDWMQEQIERLVERKKKKGIFKWRKLGMVWVKSKGYLEKVSERDEAETEVGFGGLTPFTIHEHKDESGGMSIL